jgi:hypothetical protein
MRLEITNTANIKASSSNRTEGAGMLIPSETKNRVTKKSRRLVTLAVTSKV